VISRSGSTSAAIRCNSPSRSRSAIHARRSFGSAAKAESVYGGEGVLDRSPATTRVTGRESGIAVEGEKNHVVERHRAPVVEQAAQPLGIQLCAQLRRGAFSQAALVSLEP
jgi:hypothetical protein